MVLRPQVDDLIPIVPEAMAPYCFKEDASYVTAGGLGGTGRSIARWMVSRGAKSLIFISRSGASSGMAAAIIEELQEKGCNIRAYSCDVTDNLTRLA